MKVGMLSRIGLHLAQMRLNQWKGPEELESMQLERFKALFNHAVGNVPFYKKYSGTTIRDMDDISRIPLTVKEDVRAKGDSFIASGLDKRKLTKCSTSGSTGMPLDIYQSESESIYGPVFELHQMIEAGVGPFDVHAVITLEAQRWNLLNRLGMFRRHCLRYSTAKQVAEELKKIRPSVLRGTPSFLVPIAHENLSSGIGASAKKAFTFSEVLSEKARSLVSRSFGCRVYDSYGSIESSWAAWECEKGGMHIFSDHVLAEIVDDNGEPVQDGKSGELVLTPLWRRAMPLIRYAVGDRAALGSKCACGRGSQVLTRIEGRNNDFVVLPSGAMISAHLIGYTIRGMDGILQFQAQQERSGHIRLLIIPEKNHEEAGSRVLDALRPVFPEPMDIELAMVEELPRSKSGKICDFVSKVKPRF
jgi:phenylacetate-CoA ligase